MTGVVDTGQSPAGSWQTGKGGSNGPVGGLTVSMVLAFGVWKCVLTQPVSFPVSFGFSVPATFQFTSQGKQGLLLRAVLVHSQLVSACLILAS